MTDFSSVVLIPTLVETILTKFEDGLLNVIIASSCFPRELCDQVCSKYDKTMLMAFQKAFTSALLAGVNQCESSNHVLGASKRAIAKKPILPFRLKLFFSPYRLLSRFHANFL